jgi:hypothetical protein
MVAMVLCNVMPVAIYTPRHSMPVKCFRHDAAGMVKGGLKAKGARA